LDLGGSNFKSRRKKIRAVLEEESSGDAKALVDYFLMKRRDFFNDSFVPQGWKQRSLKKAKSLLISNLLSDWMLCIDFLFDNEWLRKNKSKEISDLEYCWMDFKSKESKGNLNKCSNVLLNTEDRIAVSLILQRFYSEYYYGNVLGLRCYGLGRSILNWVMDYDGALDTIYSLQQYLLATNVNEICLMLNKEKRFDGFCVVGNDIQACKDEANWIDFYIYYSKKFFGKIGRRII